MQEEKEAVIIVILTTALFLSLGAFSVAEIMHNTQPTEQQIETTMENVETVEVQQQSFRNITVQDQNSTISQTTDVRTATKYDVTNNSYFSVTQTEERFAGNQLAQQQEEYFVNGTLYYRSQNSVQNTTAEWQTETVTYNVSNEVTQFSNATFLSQANMTTQTNNATQYHIYQINVLNHSNNSVSISQFDQYKEYLDIYEFELYVNAETNRIQNVRIAAFGELTQSQLASLDDTYESIQSSNGTISYAIEYTYGGYNEETTIRPPINSSM